MPCWGANVFSCSTVLLRRDALADRRFRTGFYHEDYVLWLELLQAAAPLPAYPTCWQTIES